VAHETTNSICFQKPIAAAKKNVLSEMTIPLFFLLAEASQFLLLFFLTEDWIQPACGNAIVPVKGIVMMDLMVLSGQNNVQVLKDPDRQRRFVHVCPFVELQ
jgi:hypothetical protein